jgi:hypothetical protein
MKTRHSIFYWILIAGLIFSMSGRAEKFSDGTMPSLEKILNQDGTLDLSKRYSGNVNPAGWRMVQGKNGEPRFLRNNETDCSPSRATAAGDENWDDQFAFPGPGLDGDVYALGVSGTDLYIGGSFTQAGAVNLKNIAKWNGSVWSSLGSGVNGQVNAIAVNGSDLYVGGNFSQAGAVGAGNIAKWNGSAWSSLGSGVNGQVNAVALSGSDLYVGGSFTQAGGAGSNRIAKWNGSAWSSLGSGVSGTVCAVAANGSIVYAGGYFASAGGVGGTGYLAKWDGSNWSSMGNPDREVLSLGINGDDVYAGGWFTQMGGAGISYFAKWDGSSWSSVGGGTNQEIYTIVINGDDVYAGGWFTQAGGISAGRIVKWNGSEWSTFGSGANSRVNAIALLGGDVYMGGWFPQAGGVDVNRIAKWHEDGWSALGGIDPGNGTNAFIRAMVVSGNDLYVGGWFTMAGGVPIRNIAKWDGTTWSSLGGGVNWSVYALALKGSDLYAGGFFTQAGGAGANYIAKWNGSSWSPLGEGMNAIVYTIAVFGNDVYAGGAFTQAGGVAVNYIAKWDGFGWSALQGGVTGFGGTWWSVEAMAVYGGELIVGGQFVFAGGLPSQNIARWNGFNWLAMGNGISGVVNAMASSGSDLYVGGWFTQIGGVTYNHIARWNGSSWFALGNGTDDAVDVITVSGSTVYVGGDFSQAGGSEASYIAKWNGSSWSALGSGTDDAVSAIAVIGSNVYMGGDFLRAGGSSSSNFACWQEQNESSDFVFPQAGWYMVSLPVIPADSSVQTLFPSALGGMAFTWDPASEAYAAVLKMEPKKGYWLAIPGSATAQIQGMPLTGYTAHFPSQGWAMIGGVMGSVDFTNPGDNPDGMVLSPAFGWDTVSGSYVPTTTLNEKQGYWAAVFGACDLTVGGTGGGELSVPSAQIDRQAFFKAQGRTPPPPPPDLGRKTVNAAELPKEYALHQNYPNPFNPVTTIRFSLPAPSTVSIVVYDLAGRTVRTLLNGPCLAGKQGIRWDGTDGKGAFITGGVYICRMRADDFQHAIKLIVAK